MNILIEKIDETIKNDRCVSEDVKSWSKDSFQQINKIKNIATTDGKFHTTNEPYMEGSEKDVWDKDFTLDIEKMTEDVSECLTWWYVPTKEGIEIDIWLIK